MLLKDMCLYYRMNKMILKLLIEHGADFEVQDADGHTPIDKMSHPHAREAIKRE